MAAAAAAPSLTVSPSGTVSGGCCFCPGCCNKGTLYVQYNNQQFEVHRGLFDVLDTLFKLCCCCRSFKEEEEANNRLTAHKIQADVVQDIRAFVPKADVEVEAQKLIEEEAPNFAQKQQRGERITLVEYSHIVQRKFAYINDLVEGLISPLLSRAEPPATGAWSSWFFSGPTSIDALLPALRASISAIPISTPKETIRSTLRPKLLEWGYKHFTNGQIFALYRTLKLRAESAPLSEEQMGIVRALFENRPLPKTALEALIPDLRNYLRVRRGQASLQEVKERLERNGYYIAEDHIISLLIEMFSTPIARDQEGIFEPQQKRYVTNLFILSERS